MSETTRTEDLPGLARRCWAALETLHITGYFEAEPREAYKALGLRARFAYFAARSAPMGPVNPGVTVATFYVFAPRLVEAALPAAWSIASPADVLHARHAGVLEALRRLLGDVDVAEAADLARQACARLTAPGRPLYAGHAGLPWPEDPLLALWHAATLVREHRGDGHVAALVHSELDPVEALITSGLYSGAIAFYRASRGWTEQEWAAGEQRLRDRGLVGDDGALTESGRRLRAELEARTDAAALEGWRGLGVDGTARLLELMRPLRRSVLAHGAFPADLIAAKN